MSFRRKWYNAVKKPKPANESVKPAFRLTEEYRNTVAASAYLGKKGYTIPKSVLAEEDLVLLYKELLVKPVIFGPGSAAPESEFAVYRENTNKIYIPRFYGIERYGLPPKCEIEEGDDISLDFAKPLRDYQDKIVDVYMKYVNTSICKDSLQNGSGGILEVPCGLGKTVMGLKIISLLKKKTLIIVHKEFLMNQWIERIAEFLPGARVGKIQGPLFDIYDKDIVIGMIQTIYDKEYQADAFSSFGLTIVDEVHRIGSEQFSRTLLKTITPNMLGISATVDRKDQLTKVLYMFIGNKIYKEKRSAHDEVCVRAIHYVSGDTEFNEVAYDFRGSPKYSTMISKLCEFGPRSDFIVKVVGDLIRENPENQIMILCHNRSLLTYLHDAIEYRKIASTGYYVGGMKQADLNETETKSIVLATYAMAAEALDIKSLSTLVMVTPKTDITQSVGRILRVKHENPIIVDIVDSHDLFQNQWKQRRQFYKKCNYHIKQIDSRKYSDMTTDKDWAMVFEPKKQKASEETPKDSERTGTIFEGKCFIQFDDMDLES
jgi:superfamily II DNA or RNA helicase